MADQMTTLSKSALDLDPGEDMKVKVSVLGTEYVFNIKRYDRDVDKLFGLITVHETYADISVDDIDTESDEWAISERAYDGDFADVVSGTAHRLRKLLLDAHVENEG